MPVGNFVDKSIHRLHTGDPQGVGKLIKGNVGLKGLIQKMFPTCPRRPQAL